MKAALLCGYFSFMNLYLNSFHLTINHFYNNNKLIQIDEKKELNKELSIIRLSLL